MRNPHFVFIYGRLSITLEFLWDCVHLAPVDNNAGSQARDGKLEHAPSLQPRDCVASRSGDCQARWQERTGRVMLVGCQHIDLLIQLAQHGYLLMSPRRARRAYCRRDVGRHYHCSCCGSGAAIGGGSVAARARSAAGRDSIPWHSRFPDNDTHMADPGTLETTRACVCSNAPGASRHRSTVLSQDPSIASASSVGNSLGFSPSRRRQRFRHNAVIWTHVRCLRPR